MAKPKETPSEEDLYKLNHTAIMGVEAEVHFSSIQDGIRKAVESQAKPTLYKISDFFRRKEFYKDLSTTIKSTYVTTDSDVNLESIQRAVLKNKTTLADFIAGRGNGYLVVSDTHEIPATDTPIFQEMASCFTKENRKVTITNRNNHEKQVIETVGFRLTENKRAKLLEIIKRLPKSQSFNINLGNSDTPSYMRDLRKLASDCGIIPSGPTIMEFPEVVDGQEQMVPFTTSHTIFKNIVDFSLTLAFQRWSSGQKERREITNIRNSDQHGFINRPANMSLLEAFSSATSRDSNLQTLLTSYRTPEAQAQANGLRLTASSQALLPIFDASNDYETLQQILTNQIPMFIDTVLMLQAYLRDHPGEELVDLKELAKYLPRYERDIATKGSFRPQYRLALFHSLQLLKIFEIPYYDSDTKDGGKVYKFFRFINLDEVVTDKRGNVKKVKASFTPEYLATFSRQVGVILDGIPELDIPQLKMLGVYISDCFVTSASRMKKTTQGEPVVKTASDLAKAAGLTDNVHKSRRYETLADYLDKLQENGKIIRSWHLDGGGTKFNEWGTGNGQLRVHLYPSRNISDAYITSAQNRAEKTANGIEQKNRLNLLKKKARGYTDLEILAKDIGVTSPELNLLLAGEDPLTDELLAIIEDL